jgi:hypothetical protein
VINQLIGSSPLGTDHRIHSFTPIGAVGWQEEELGAGGADAAANGLSFAAAEIIHEDDVAGTQGRHQDLST